MLLMLNWMRGIFVGVKAINLGSRKAWVHDLTISSWAGPVYSVNAVKPVTSYVQPVESCSQLLNHASKTLVATVVDAMIHNYIPF